MNWNMPREIEPTILAIVLVVLGISFLVQPGRWQVVIRSILAEPHRYFPGALVELALGLWLALSYDRWDSTWPIFTSVFGWLMALEGSAFLIAPGLFRFLDRLNDRFVRIYLRAGGLIVLVLGSLLGRFVFSAS